MGEQALTSILEQLYTLIIIEKRPPQKILKKLCSKPGRRSVLRKYLEAENLQKALNLLEEDLKAGRISRRTYYRAKKLLANNPPPAAPLR